MNEEIQQQQQAETAARIKAQQVSETALTKTETKLEKIKNVSANKTVLAARDGSGRFQKRALALANDTAKRILKVAYEPDETGKTMVEQVAASQLVVARDNKDPRNLGQIGSFLETLDKVTGQELIRQKIAKETDDRNVVRKIEISINLAGEVIDYEAQLAAQRQKDKLGPSWAHAELVEQNPPQGKDQC
jgi:hypothetical protein